MSLKQKKIKFKPRTKLNHNKYASIIFHILYMYNRMKKQKKREEEQGMVKW